MILVCYRTGTDTGWKTFMDERAMDRWLFDNPDKYAAYVFVSGPQYNIDTIEQAKFMAGCKSYGFEPSDYRRFMRTGKNRTLELYGFENGKCLLRDVRDGSTVKMDINKVKRG